MGNFVKNHKKLIGFVGLAFFFIVIIIALIGGALYDQESQNMNDCASGDDGAAVSGSAGEWTKKGTLAYNTAQALFKSWVDEGCSGAAAAGIVGFITGEGGTFSIPDRAEGHFGTDEKSNGVAYGVVPIPAGNYKVGGAGIYQITPYTEYAGLSDKKWLNVAGQTSWFKKHKIPGWNPAYDGSGKAHSFEAFKKLTSVADATRAWNAAEIGNANKMQTRIDNANKAYQMFDGAKFKAKSSTLAGSISTADDAEAASQGDCDDGDIPTSGDWGWPFAGMSYNSAKSIIKGEPYQGFGYTGGGRMNGYHDGVDFGTAHYNNKDIHAIHGGKVTKIAHSGYDNSTLGWYVWVKSGDGWNEIYQEFGFSDSDKQYIKVKSGQNVKAGDTIGHLTQHGIVNHVHIGTTKKDFAEAIGHSFDPSGGWKDPIETINNGMKNAKKEEKANSTDNADSDKTSGK